MITLEKNLREISDLISGGNDRGEQITLVGATKTVDAETVNKAISLGLKVVAENKVQEFREKTDLIKGAEQHFIGHLQTNKVKYVVGKVKLIHSVDSLRLAEEINNFAFKRGIVQDILAEINAGDEDSKSGFSFTEVNAALLEIKKLKNVRLTGLMAMFPKSSDEKYIASLCKKMRALYDEKNREGYGFTVLSMGMTEDYKIAVKNGSNTIRIGSGIFGKRNYGVI